MLLPVGDRAAGATARQWFPERGESAADLTPSRCVELIRAAVGVEDLEVRVLARLPFVMAAELADAFRAGNGFLVGDAAHRMTPVGGVGMNTAIAAGHNLGWKLAWVARGWAGPELLDSYELERRTPGEYRARRSLRMGGPPEPDPLGEDLGVRYASSVVAADAGERAPHAWVTVDGRRRSTLDLFDGRLTLLVGRDAAAWRAAADRIAGRAPAHGRRRRSAGWRCAGTPGRPRGLAGRDRRAPRGPAAGGAGPDTGSRRGQRERRRERRPELARGHLPAVSRRKVRPPRWGSAANARCGRSRRARAYSRCGRR